eukprot:TRINITY_DN821_c0_g1_i2.p1 TRINITY_DN821_c0_g1~~TRINITY_DN821_c0_g1_i2.p1  ORF type:complete len:127 (-),score=30.13 TRINITY_DN821_c0_g1_i2:201-581(-)
MGKQGLSSSSSSSSRSSSSQSSTTSFSLERIRTSNYASGTWMEMLDVTKEEVISVGQHVMMMYDDSMSETDKVEETSPFISFRKSMQHTKNVENFMKTVKLKRSREAMMEEEEQLEMEGNKKMRTE